MAKPNIKRGMRDIPWTDLNPDANDVVIAEDEEAGGHGPSHKHVGVEPNDIGPGTRTISKPHSAPAKTGV